MLNVRCTLQDELDGEAGMMKELSSKWTLCTPPLLFHVTISPTLTPTCLGTNWLAKFELTVWLAANAGATGSTRATTMPIPRPRMLMS